jgi:non-lysosomal glucosylceramidase
MHGVSAYCGSLWLAALHAMVRTAAIVGKKAEAARMQKILEKATTVFEQKLWNGEYYDFCEGNNDIMADQLIGQWYCDILGETSILPKDHIRSALETIYKNNFKGTVRGKWGVVSGKTKENKMVEEEQGRDVWVGANFALATLFMKNGMEKEAQEVLDTMSDIIYRRGFFFRTPEGWDTEGQFTATMYMRPNAVWALEF